MNTTRINLKSLALAASIGAVVFASISPSAQAALIGQWLSGAENYTNTSGYLPGSHDGVKVGTIANLSFDADVPPGCSGKSLKLAGGAAVRVANSTTPADGGTYANTFDEGIQLQCTIAFWAKGFPGGWSPWLAKRGEGGGSATGWQFRRMDGDTVAGFTVRGLDNADGTGSTINVNDNPAVWHHFAVVWDKVTGTRKLYVDGVFSHTVTNTIDDNMALAADHPLMLGARTTSSPTDYHAYFTGKLFDVRIYNTTLTQSEVQALIPPAVPTGLVSGPGDTKVGLRWTPVADATSYTVVTMDMSNNVLDTDYGITSTSFTKGSLVNGTSYLFKVSATKGAVTSPYSAEISQTPAMGSANDMLTFTFGPYGNGIISGNTITKYLPSSVNLATLAPTYTTSFFAAGSPGTGIAPNFNLPQTYTITSESGVAKVYTVTVTVLTPITYDFNADLQGWTQIYPTPPGPDANGNLRNAAGHLGSGGDNAPTRQGRSPAFYLLNAGPLTFSLNGGRSPLTAPDVGPSAIPSASAAFKFAGVALRDVATNSYVLSRGKKVDGGWESLQFTAAELAPFANDGKQYTLDYIDYKRGGYGEIDLDNVSIPGVAALPAVAASLSVKTYDSTFGDAYLAPISNLQAGTPSASFVTIGEISHAPGSFMGNVPGITDNETFSMLWEGWFDVSKEGPGEYSFGTQSDDGSMVYLDLNNDGDFVDAGELVVNNNGGHAYQIRTGTVNLPMSPVRFAIGYYENTGGEGMQARFRKGNTSDFSIMSVINGTSGHFRSTPPPAYTAALWNLTYNGQVARTSDTNLVLPVTLGSSTMLSPTFTLSPGATCVPASGTELNFSSPKTYTVTAAGGSPTTVYTVSIAPFKGYNFNDNTLQGWQNRVWDLSANGGAGGWIDLAPNATTMPASVNGGVIQPPSPDNGLFNVEIDGLGNGATNTTGHDDNHLNTQWLRSPAFYLDAWTDLTLQTRKGNAYAANPTNEASVPFSATTNNYPTLPAVGGWKGAILRRVSDGAFLIVKPRNGAIGDPWVTTTFTAAELAPYDGEICTIELINSDRGSYGWVSMDNVFIPTTGLIPSAAYDIWANGTFGNGPLTDKSQMGDPDDDKLNNLQEYAFGTDPTVSAPGPMVYMPGGNVTTPGQPILLSEAGTYYAVFCRRKDYLAARLTYTVEFSADLSSPWVPSPAVPTRLTSDPSSGDVDAVSVPFLGLIPTDNGQLKARFFRVAVSQ